MSHARNLFAVTAASFIGFMGFTLVMPFLPLYFHQLGVQDVGRVAMWSGLSLGVTPAMTALLSPLWGRLADRFGRKIMVERSLVSFVVIMAAMGAVTRPWHVFALRVVQGVFAGYGALSVAMAADSASEGGMSQAMGTVQTARRLGPALGPVFGGTVAAFVGLRRAFLVASACYEIALVLVFRYSAFGLRMRSVVESPRLTELAGVDADKVSMGSWALSSAIAGLAGVLLVPVFWRL